MKILAITIILNLIAYSLNAQSDCYENSIVSYSAASRQFQNYTLVQTPDNNIIISGCNQDSLVLVKIGFDLKVKWCRSFYIASLGRPLIVSLHFDDEDKLLIAGEVGGAFIMKYDPVADKVEWTNLINGTDGYSVSFFKQIRSGEDYMLCLNSVGPDDNAQLFFVNRMTGNILVNSGREFNLGGSETIYNLIDVDGRNVAFGRITNGYSTTDMRSAIMEFDPVTNDLLRHNCFNHSLDQSSRIYGIAVS